MSLRAKGLVAILAGVVVAVWFPMRSAAADTGVATPAPSASATPSVAVPGFERRFGVHVQATNTQQYHGAFPAAYSGPQSLTNTPDTAKTFTATLFAGVRVWHEAALYLDEEVDQGFGFDQTLGLAGFSNAEAYKIGAARPYERLHRVFIRQTFDSGAATDVLTSDQNQLPERVSPTRTVVTVGKYSVVDIFDDNTYAHDPRNDFLNWAVVDMGAFDYAADAWGYTYGVTASFIRPESALDVGLFQLSKEPNAIAIEHVPFLQYSPVIQWSRSLSLFGDRPGRVRLLAYGNYGYMAPLADATAAALASGTTPNPAGFRSKRHWKLGEGVNLEQQLRDGVGFFARASADNGSYETFDFTEIDRSVEAGFSFDGSLWHRPGDTLGIAGVVNGISAVRQRYLAAGGLGILIGDGALSYAPERILESYYRLGIARGLSVKFDYQRFVAPAYNTARGPVSIYTLQLHEQL